MTATGADWLIDVDWAGLCLRGLRRLDIDARKYAADAHVELLVTFEPSEVSGYTWRESQGYDNGERFIVSHEPSGDGSELTEDGFIIGTAEAVFDALCGAPSSPWPPCPEHSNHSLAALSDSAGLATWTCPTSGRRTAPIGQL